MYAQIPVTILEQYEGKWIVWDQQEQRVLGSGPTLEEAEREAERTPTTNLLRVHHVLPRDVEIAGML